MLVGRTRELRTLDRLLAGARLGEAAALVLIGDPGVGKSALLEHGTGLAREFRVLRARGVETEQDLPFTGLSQLLGPALGLLETIPAPQADALAAALALRPGSPGDRFAVGAAVMGLVSRYAEAGPVLLVVDDAHLLDRPSLLALAFAARRWHADPVLLLVAARESELGEALSDLPTLTLGGLAPEPARELVSSVVGPAGLAGFEDLYRRTRGNPLALLELAAHPGAGSGGPGASVLPDRVPEAVTASFGRRLGHLGGPTRRALLVVAVAGEDLGVAAAACRALDLDPACLGEAEDAGLVSLEPGHVEFRHPLLRAAVYAGAAPSARREAHRAVAAALGATDPDRRAWHLAEASVAPDEQVAALLSAAGDHACARSAYAVAASAYRRAATLTPDAGPRARRQLRAAEAAWLAGEPERATALLDELVDLPAASGLAAPVLELRAGVAARSGELREAMDLLVTAADGESSPDHRVVLLADAVHAGFYLGDTATSVRLADRLTELLPSTSSPRARALGTLAAGIARVLAGQGGTEEVRAAVPLLESSEDLRTDPRRWPWLMLAPLFLRDADGGGRLRSLVDEVRGAAGIGALPAVLFHVARDRATTDDWDSARVDYDEAVRLARETGQTTELAASLAGRCWLASRQGDAGRCRTDAEEALGLCRTRSIHLAEAWVVFARADLALSEGDPAAAEAEFSVLLDQLAERGMGDPDLSPVPELVDALLRVGRRREAEELVPGFRAAAERKGLPWACARARRAAALVADEGAAEEHFEAAAALHAATLDGFEAARTELAHGEWLRRSGRRVDARVRLRAALDTFDRLGASRWSERAAAELTATGETVQRLQVGWRAALTPQELQVALLLVEGRTTREAAAALFVSPKTVEYHLRKVYVKLDIHSREELRVALAGAL